MLPTQSPVDAADELERTIAELVFKGVLINGHTNGHYLDEDALLAADRELGSTATIDPYAAIVDAPGLVLNAG